MLSGAGAERETNKEVALLRSKSSFFFFSKTRTFYFLTVTDSTALRINTARCIMVTAWQARRFYTYQSCSEWCHARKKEEEEKKEEACPFKICEADLKQRILSADWEKVGTFPLCHSLMNAGVT